jgi:potassium-dependent mechanosensitive channel
MTAYNLKETNVVKSKIILILTLLFICAVPAPAQLDALLKSSETATEEKPVKEIREQLETWRKDVSDELARLEKFQTQEDLPEGVELSLLNTRRRHLDQSQLTISRHLIILDDVTKAREDLVAARKTANEWTGFGQDAPTSILKVDELVSSRDALLDKIASNRSSLDVFQNTLDSLLDDAKSAADRVATALTAYEAAPKGDPPTLWKLETYRASQRFIFIRASSLAYGIAAQKSIIETSEVELATINKMIREARKTAVFSAEDLELIKAASSDRQKVIRKETTAVRKRLKEANAEQEPAAALANLSTSQEQPDPILLERTQLEVDALEARKRALQEMIDALESTEQIESFIPEAYELRLELLNSKSDSERIATVEALRSIDQRLNAWQAVSKNQLDSVSADIGKQQARAAAFPTDDPRLTSINRIRSVLWEQQSILQRAYESVTSQRRVLASWLDTENTTPHESWYTRFAGGLSSIWTAAKNLWNIPVNKYEESIEIDGQKVTYTRFVSLGSLFTALVLFVIAYMIASRISRKIQRLMVSRGFIAENQARTLRTWLMLVVAFLLALATLSWLNIPLTIFAFLAGALAIGVGFGTQTIIKNFISGIILLFERKIRVGDILEVDGITGTVSEINTRSSIVRGFNGIENLIPNSLFLERRVVNWTLNNRLFRREVKIAVVCGSPTNDVIDILVESAQRHGLILKTPPPFATFSNFGEKTLEFTLYFWVELNDKTNSLIVDSDVRIMIDKSLDEAGIHLFHYDRLSEFQAEEPPNPPKKPEIP